MNELLGWIAHRNPPLLFERSLRLQPETVEARRCLLSFPTRALGDAAEAEVLQICRAMSSPDSHLRAIQRYFRGAAHVHFGFEYSGRTVIGKCYLELANSGSADLSTSRLKFLGYKWSMNDASVAVVSRYRTVPISTWEKLVPTIQQQIQDDYRSSLSELLNSFQPSVGSNLLADLPVLEVQEEGSDRRSYDLNVYALERTVTEVAASIRTVAALLGGDFVNLLSWITANGDATVGHIAIGQSRTGHPFVTIYHSADINATL